MHSKSEYTANEPLRNNCNAQTVRYFRQVSASQSLRVYVRHSKFYDHLVFLQNENYSNTFCKNMISLYVLWLVIQLTFQSLLSSNNADYNTIGQYVFFFSSFVISRGATKPLSKQYTFMDVFVLFANFETSDNFTGNLIPLRTSSNSCSQVLYLVTVCGCLSTGCKAERTAQRMNLSLSFAHW